MTQKPEIQIKNFTNLMGEKLMVRKFGKLFLAVGIFASATLAFGQSSEMRNPEIIKTSAHDVSPELRSIPPAPWPSGVRRVVPNERIPLPAGIAVDTAVVESDAAQSVTAVSAPSVGLNFDGVGVPNYSVLYAPPDTNGDVGATQYVQIVNVALAVFDKATGARTYGPANSNTIWNGFGGGCATNNDGDAVVKYDKAAGRWIISQFSVSTTPYTECVAVSQTSDALGAYNRYAFTYTQFNDYPKMGVWPDGYYVTYNMFTSTFQGAKVCALDRARMLAGSTATQQCFQLGTSFGGLLPSDWYGAAAPPAGSPNYMMNYGSSKLNLWKFHVDWTTPGNSTLTGPTAIPVTAFTAACNGGTCIPQPARQKLDSLADRLMNSLVYRNRSGVESLLVNHSVTSGTTASGVRWYEIRNPGATPTVYQSNTYSPDSTSRWMGSIAMDQFGNIAMGYSASSSSVNPSVRYTGRLSTDALGTMQAETIAQAGGGSQTKNGSKLSRWGDYSSMSVDPSNDCTFWFTTEYLKSNGVWNWSTKITSFKFPGCN